MTASGSHVESGRGGPWGEGCSSVLSSGLWSSPPSLSQWCSSKTDLSSPSVNGKSIPPQTSDSNFALDFKVEESCYPPIALAGLPPWCPLPGLNDTSLQSRKLNQNALGSQPHKGTSTSTHHVVRGSTKDLHFSEWWHPSNHPKMGLQDIHSPEALKQHAGLSFCPWCGKEGQNEGTMVNHLHTRHYCLGLVCERCLLYFTTKSDKMWLMLKSVHMPSCKNNGDREVEIFNWAH